MKRSLFITAAAALIFAASCSGGSKPASGGPSASTVSAIPAESTDQVITRLEHEWVAAIVKKDTGTIERLLADDFSGTTDDQIYSKMDAIEDVKTGTHESLDLDNNGHYLFTDVWAKKNGEWIAVASHGSRVR